MDGFLLVVWAIRLLFLALLYLFLYRVDQGAAARPAGSRSRACGSARAGWSSSSRRAASRWPAIRSGSMSSPRSVVT